MRLRTSKLALAVIAVAIATVAAPAIRAQAPVPIEGVVLTAGAREPVVGAVVDIYRIDIKGKYDTKTDKRGVFTYPLPQFGTFTIIVSGPGLSPQYRTDVRVGSGPRLEFEMQPGNGQRPTLEDVAKAQKGGGPKAEDPKAAEERAKMVEEHEKAVAQKAQFDERKARFDAGIAAMTSKDYPTAVTELSAAIDGLENADPVFFGELVSVGGSNLAETHYRMAVELYNKKEKDEAKEHLELAKKASELSLRFDATKQVNYLIQAKVLGLLVERFSDTDDAETAVAAWLKAADLETAEPKKKIVYLADAGDVYRHAYMTDKAIELYRKVLASDSTNTDALYGIGLAAMAASGDDQDQLKTYYQTAADYLAEFVKKSGQDDPRVGEAKGVLDTLGKDFKIKPRPIK